MRHTFIAAIVLMALAQGTALADGTPLVVPPPVETTNSCQIQLTTCEQTVGQDKKDLAECRQSLDVSNQTSDALVKVIKENKCGEYTGMTDDEIVVSVRTHTPPPKKDPPKKVDTGHKNPPPPPPAPKPTLTIKIVPFTGERDGCSNGGLTVSTVIGDKVLDTKALCNGKDGAKGDKGDKGDTGKTGAQGPRGLQGIAGKNGESGRDGYSRIQLNLGTRVASIFSAGRPNGYSVAPELGMKYWLSPTAEFNLGAAWAPGRDRNMVITGDVCYRPEGSSFGYCAGGQYIGWNLVGGLALWHSGLGTVSLKYVAVETRHVDLSFTAGAGAGFDGYDKAMQFAWGATGSGALTVKF